MSYDIRWGQVKIVPSGDQRLIEVSAFKNLSNSFPIEIRFWYYPNLKKVITEYDRRTWSAAEVSKLWNEAQQKMLAFSPPTTIVDLLNTSTQFTVTGDYVLLSRNTDGQFCTWDRVKDVAVYLGNSEADAVAAFTRTHQMYWQAEHARLEKVWAEWKEDKHD